MDLAAPLGALRGPLRLPGAPGSLKSHRSTHPAPFQLALNRAAPLYIATCNTSKINRRRPTWWVGSDVLTHDGANSKLCAAIHSANQNLTRIFGLYLSSSLRMMGGKPSFWRNRRFAGTVSLRVTFGACSGHKCPKGKP